MGGREIADVYVDEWVDLDWRDQMKELHGRKANLKKVARERELADMEDAMSKNPLWGSF